MFRIFHSLVNKAGSIPTILEIIAVGNLTITKIARIIVSDLNPQACFSNNFTSYFRVIKIKNPIIITATKEVVHEITMVNKEVDPVKTRKVTDSISPFILDYFVAEKDLYY